MVYVLWVYMEKLQRWFDVCYDIDLAYITQRANEQIENGSWVKITEGVK